ncbi:DUF1993 family protein [Celeribacter sp.]|uniref:DUF1993 family protein n=1 Tax=Celeribacter sp. TaxID=1890673 RepID=UPI003A9110E8
MTEFATATLATFRHYLAQIDRLVIRIAGEPQSARLFSLKVSPDGFDVAQQLGIALNFAARAVYPVVGRELPAWPETFPEEVLRSFGAQISEALATVAPADFADAPVSHVAGFAELEQPPADYMIRFALPNMMFHFAMAYAALRADGVDIGKSDFDGLHAYPSGFAFDD